MHIFEPQPPRPGTHAVPYGLYAAAHGHMFTSNHEQGDNVSIRSNVCTLGSVQACVALQCRSSAGQRARQGHASPS